MKKTDEEIMFELGESILAELYPLKSQQRERIVARLLVKFKRKLQQARQSEREEIKKHLLKHGSGEWRRIIEQLN